VSNLIERTILSSLMNEQEYIRKVIPYIDVEYFRTMGEKVVFSLIKEHYTKYNTLPNKEMLKVVLDSKNIRENFYDQAVEVLGDLNYTGADIKWLTDATEDFCKRRAYFNAISKASEFLDGDDTNLYHKSLDLVSKALSVNFDSDLGSDYFKSAADRFDAMKQGYDQMPTTLSIFNKVTKGGFVNPSLTVFMAPTGVGKSLFLCNIAASYLQIGKNVLYFTMEMSQTQVENRIDLNLLNLTKEQIEVMEKSQFVHRIDNLRNKFAGNLRVKEYPSTSVHSGHFRFFIEELKLKDGFVPDIIIVDYIGICRSATMAATAPRHEVIGQIAVELRGIGQEFKCPVFSAIQTNRDGTKASDFEVTDIAESWGVTHHADYIFGVVETEELAKLNQMKIKRLKDRYNDYKTWYTSFIIGVDKTKQRLYDINNEDELVDAQSLNNELAAYM
jgi:replicative DNA helicase